MEWKDLSTAAGCVLERCWGITSDKPRSSTWELNVPYQIYNDTVIVTQKVIEEILEYQKTDPLFDVVLKGNKLTVSGNCDYGSWDSK